MMRAIADGDAEAFIDESQKHRAHAIAVLAEALKMAGIDAKKTA